MSDIVGFFRKNGHVIPIRAASGTSRTVKGATNVARVATVAASAAAVHKSAKTLKGSEHKSVVKVNKGLDALGLATAIGSGALGAATFSMGTKGFIGGAIATHAIDAVGIGVNAASVAGKGHKADRVKQGARQEARNLIIGNAVYGAGLLASKKNRATIISAAQKVIAFGRKALRVI